MPIYIKICPVNKKFVNQKISPPKKLRAVPPLLPLSFLSWVSDVALTHPVVWSTALCFFHSSSLHKVRHQGSFLLLLTRRHDYQVWQWSPEPLQWAWHVTSTEDIEVSLTFFPSQQLHFFKLSEEYQSAYMMPVMEGVAGHTLLNSASCQWQRKGNHDESLPLPQFHLTPNVSL